MPEKLYLLREEIEWQLAMNGINKRAVFLDFDGVLFDTVKEAYCVSMISLGKASDVSDVNLAASHFHEFFRFRFLVGPAWNYYYMMQLIDEKNACPSLDIAASLRDAIRHADPVKHSPFEASFFKTRKFLRETNYQVWLSLITPYEFVNELLDLMEGHLEKFFLITTRDRDSVLHILKMYDLMFLENSVFGKDEYGVSNSKRDIIQRLIGDHQIKESIFIDDLEDHLMACWTIENLSSIHARWGYVAPENKEDNSARVIRDIRNFIQEENVWN